MDKYQEFFKIFKVTLTNSTFYAPTHPKFKASVQDFQSKLQEITGQESSLTLNIKPDAIVIDHQEFKEDEFCKDLAETIHLKKVKSIQISRNVTIDELSAFILGVGINRDLILEQGGLKKILEMRGVKAIHIETLDYSQLVKGSGQEIEDTWQYLFGSDKLDQKVVNPKEYSKKIQNAFDKYGVKELLDSIDSSENLFKVLSQLKKEDQEAYKECVLCLSRNILKTNNLSLKNSSGEIKNLFSSMKAKDFKDILVSLFQSEQEIDPLSFELFSSFVDTETHKETADLLDKEIRNKRDSFNMNLAKKLFTSLKNEEITPFYRRKLSFADDAPEQKFFLDYEHLYDNYRLILLDMFLQEKNLRRLKTIIERISTQLHEPGFENFEYFKDFKEIYDQKIIDEKMRKELVPLTQGIWSFAEKSHFNCEDSRQFNYLLSILERSSLDPEYYYDRIFQDNTYNELTLKLFFQFYSKDIYEFCSYLDSKIKDKEFLNDFVDCLSGVDDYLSLETLKYIFRLSSTLDKIELLECFKNLSIFDREFLLNLVKEDNFALRKKAIEVIIHFKTMNKEVVRVLFSSHYFFAFNNKSVLEDLDILEEIYLPEAIPHLKRLSKDILFWNRELTTKAKRILKKYANRSN